MTTLHERVSRLEASAFRTEEDERAKRAAMEQLAEQSQAFTARAVHLGDAVDTMSGDVRALAHEIHAEIVPRLDNLERDVTQLKADVTELKADVTELKNDMRGVKQGVGALLAHFNITPQ